MTYEFLGFSSFPYHYSLFLVWSLNPPSSPVSLSSLSISWTNPSLISFCGCHSIFVSHKCRAFFGYQFHLGCSHLCYFPFLTMGTFYEASNHAALHNLVLHIVNILNGTRCKNLPIELDSSIRSIRREHDLAGTWTCLKKTWLTRRDQAGNLEWSLTKRTS